VRKADGHGALCSIPRVGTGGTAFHGVAEINATLTVRPNHRHACFGVQLESM